MENDNLSEIIYILADELNDFADKVCRLQMESSSKQPTAAQPDLVSIDSPTKPQQGEVVIVWTTGNTFYCQTYLGSFTSSVTHWLRITPPQGETTNANETN